MTRESGETTVSFVITNEREESFCFRMTGGTVEGHLLIGITKPGET
jgi:hypothetical protein